MVMQHSLFIKSRFCPEVVERILRVIRHRGFTLCSLNVLYCDTIEHRQIEIVLTVSSNREICLLYKQLNKLMDVNYIEIR